MKKIALLIMCVVVSGTIFAQKNDKDSVLSKKEIRQIEMEKQYELTKYMLENKSFVLEADFLQDKYGNRVFASSNINFVSVDSATAVIQVGSNFRIGPNGVGGVTAKGTITKYELKENERKRTFSLALNVMTPLGIYDLRFSISPSGNTRATLTGLRRGQLTFEGDLVPLEESRVYEGQSL
ncbi:DUF4251 domain-containing protein [Sunxiuqinia indica]|uniref:DUF4251 domain-containing protein n=1 Tax=Sunxiuqinia indica TaxID=2692584 RepID=UPI00135B60CB|nr:DUF4251 domain-containing protein [Sunxiuqinia indica]